VARQPRNCAGDPPLGLDIQAIDAPWHIGGHAQRPLAAAVLLFR